MLGLNAHILILIVWLSFFFNIERLDGVGDRFLNIAPPIYLVVTAVVVVGLLLPAAPRTPSATIYTVAALLYISALSIIDRPLFEAGYVLVSVFELGAVLLSAVLTASVARRLADFVDAVRALVFSDTLAPLYTPGEGHLLVKRELQYARRTNHPLSVMVVDLDPDGAQAALHETTREIQKLLAKRYSLIALAKQLARRVRRTDFVLYQEYEGYLLLIAPRTGEEEAQPVMERIKEGARQSGGNARFGLATFPEDGVTFEELVFRAKGNLGVSERNARGSLGTDVELPATGPEPNSTESGSSALSA